MAWCTRRLPSQEPGPVAGDEHGRTASQHPRRARPEVATGAAASPAVFPSKTPQPAPRAVLRAAVGRSSDSWARRRGPPPTSAASQGIGPQCFVAGSFPITAAGQCRNGHRRRHRLPFQSGGEQPTRTDEPQDSGGNQPGQRQILWMAACLVAQAFLPRRPGAAVAARPSRLRSQAPGRRFTSREHPAHSWCAVRIAPP